MAASSDNIRAVYDARRLQRDLEREERVARIRSDYPELAALEDDILRAAGDLLQAAADVEQSSAARAKLTMLRTRRSMMLQSLGIPADYADVRPFCTLCGDQGWVDGHRCTCYRDLLNSSKLISDQLELTHHERFENYDLSLFPQAERAQRFGFKKFAENYVDSFRESTDANLYFFGSSGTGKTFLLGCIANALHDQGVAVYYIGANRLRELLARRQTLLRIFNPDLDEVEENEQQYARILDVELLMIDDLGSETRDEAFQADLLTLLDERYRYKRATIITGNLAPADMLSKKVYDERLVSRLVGHYRLLRFEGADIRREVAERRSQRSET